MIIIVIIELKIKKILRILFKIIIIKMLIILIVMLMIIKKIIIQEIKMIRKIILVIKNNYEKDRFK